MVKKRAELDWIFSSEEEQSTDRIPAAEGLGNLSEPQKPSRVRRAIHFVSIAAVLAVAASVVAYVRYEALQGVKIIEQEVKAAAQAEQWIQNNAPHLSAAVLAPNAQRNRGVPGSMLHIEHTWFTGDVAAANLTLTKPATDDSAEATYRQTRFYKETEQGWWPAQPDPALWGAPRVLETDDLIWRYRQRDHAAVAAIADKIAALYVRLTRDYGLARSMGDDKLVINVRVDALPGLLLFHDSPPGPLVVASPSVHRVPVERTDAEILEQAVALALLKNLWAQAVVQHGIEESWPSMAGVSLWELWDMGLSLSEWREDIVQWVYAGDTAAALPARYPELCAAHSIWMATPIAIGVPLHCSNQDNGPGPSNGLLPDLKRYHAEGLRAVDLHYTAQRPVRLGDTMLMYAVIDYTVTAFGRERLPELVTALGEHDTWETLIPDVYGMSVEKFDLGWQAYMSEKYGVGARTE